MNQCRADIETTSVASRVRVSLMVTLALTPLPMAASLQQPYTISLDHGFSSITGLVELSDGSIAVADDIEKTIMVARPDGTHPTQVGRNGMGPGEYDIPYALIPARDGRAIVYDATGRRYQLLGPNQDLSHGPSITTGPAAASIPIGTDSEGRLYYREGYGAFMPGGGPGSTPRLFNYNVDDRSLRYITHLELPQRRNIPVDYAPGETYLIRAPQPFAGGDAWAIDPRGGAWVVRHASNSLERYSETGELVATVSLPYEQMTSTPADQREFLDEWTHTVRQEATQIDTDRLIENATRNLEFPSRRWAFHMGQSFIDPEGRMWLPLFSAASGLQRFDLIDSSGGVVSSVDLPARSRLLGFGRTLAYVGVRDDSGLVWIHGYERN